MEKAGHLCCFHGVPLLPAPLQATTRGLSPFALPDSLPIRNLFKWISLLTLREKVVRVLCKSWKHSVFLPSGSGLPLFLPALAALASPSSCLPLSRSFSNSSCNLTKRAFLSEKSSPSPSLHVDRLPSPLHSVRLVNCLLPVPSPRTCTGGTGVLLRLRVPARAELCRPVPVLTSKGLRWQAGRRGPVPERKRAVLAVTATGRAVLAITATGRGGRFLLAGLGLPPSHSLVCLVSLPLHPQKCGDLGLRTGPSWGSRRSIGHQALDPVPFPRGAPLASL